MFTNVSAAVKNLHTNTHILRASTTVIESPVHKNPVLEPNVDPNCPVVDRIVIKGLGAVTILLPEYLDPNFKKESNSIKRDMNPLSETPESYTNGMTSTTKSPGSALKTRLRQKKAPELAAVEKRNWLIHILYIKRDFESCKKVIREQLEDTRGMCEYANYVQGLILRHEGKIQESFELFQLCNILNPSSIENIKQMARCLFLLGRHNLAIEAYSQAEAKTEKPDWEIYHNMGICYLYLKDYESAKEQLSFALDHNKHHMTFSTLAKIYQTQNDLTSAIATFRVATEHFPENAELHTSLGLLYMQIGKFQQAFEHLGTALTFEPENTRAILAAGSMMQSHQDYDVALSKYRIAARKIPESPPLWNNIAMCFFGKKKYVAAISCLKRANYLAPFDWKILYNLGLVHLTMQQYASAFHFLSAAINLKPTKGHIFMLLAVTLTYLEDEENAQQAYEQAVKLEEKDPNVCLNYAIFLHNKNDQLKAKILYNQFETRLVQFRQATGSDLDPESLDAGARLASTIGVDTFVLSKKSKARLQATVDPKPNDGPLPELQLPQHGFQPNTDEKLPAPEDTTIPILATEAPLELEDNVEETERTSENEAKAKMVTNASLETDVDNDDIDSDNLLTNKSNEESSNEDNDTIIDNDNNVTDNNILDTNNDNNSINDSKVLDNGDSESDDFNNDSIDKSYLEGDVNADLENDDDIDEDDEVLVDDKDHESGSNKNIKVKDLSDDEDLV